MINVDDVIYRQKQYIEYYEREVSNIKRLERCLEFIKNGECINVYMHHRYSNDTDEKVMFFIHGEDYDQHIINEICKHLEVKISLYNKTKADLAARIKR